LQLTFLTLFLGLISGSQSVALTAGPEVESIEILVDGGPVARVADPPWEAVVDFGPGLLPHHLVARGLDARGREVAAAEQWLNLPRPPAEVEVVLERAAEGPPRAVRLTWQSVTNERPAAISLTLDGKPLALDGDGRPMLPPPPAPPRSAARAGRLKPPPRNPVSAAHVLSAELNFAGGIVARKDLALGDDYGDEVSTDLTAFAVRLRKGGELPPAARLQGWFSAAGKPLRVSASLRFISTLATSFPGPGLPFQLFAGSQEFDAGAHGLPWLLSHAVHEGEEEAGQRLADAVAVAGVQADAGSGPRAVLLVVAGSAAADQSRYDGPAVRRYLAAIHVPLVVWDLGTPDDATKSQWGAVKDISSWTGLAAASHALADELDAQRLVLVEGRLLPQSITFSPAAEAVLEPFPAP
jgi:hypothetical protein